MGGGVPELVERELLDVVSIVVAGVRVPDGTTTEVVMGDQGVVEEAIGDALMLWASRGNPVTLPIDRMIERAVRSALQTSANRRPA